MIQISVNQVGKRWFICKAKGLDVEASYGVGTDYKKETEYRGVSVIRWNFTGKGARKHKDEIVAAITTHLEEEGHLSRL